MRSERLLDLRTPVGAGVIDARGHYLVPGLMDTHGHVAALVGPAAIEQPPGFWLGYGITGVRDATGIGREHELVDADRVDRLTASPSTQARPDAWHS